MQESHSTFDGYCKERWGMSKTHANRLIDSVVVRENLTPMGVVPTSERQGRPLTSLEPEQQKEVWQKAVETAPEGRVNPSFIFNPHQPFIPAGMKRQNWRQP
jgi:hypothetical protein